MGCHAALEEIGLPYALRFIGFDKPWPEEDLALNPNHKVPTLIDRTPDGPDDVTIIYQSAAILLYLADNHPDVGLIPATGSPERGRCYQWLFFMAEMLQPSYQMFYYPERHTSADNPEGLRNVETKAIEWIADIWGRIDRSIADTKDESGYFLSSGFGVCDLYMLPMALWNESDARFPSLDGYPNVSRILTNMRARPTVQRMIEAHSRG